MYYVLCINVSIDKNTGKVYLSNEQDKTCHLVDKSVVEQQNSLVADLGTTSYTLLPLG